MIACFIIIFIMTLILIVYSCIYVGAEADARMEELRRKKEEEKDEQNFQTK